MRINQRRGLFCPPRETKWPGFVSRTSEREKQSARKTDATISPAKYTAIILTLDVRGIPQPHELLAGAQPQSVHVSPLPMLCYLRWIIDIHRVIREVHPDVFDVVETAKSEDFYGSSHSWMYIVEAGVQP